MAGATGPPSGWLSGLATRAQQAGAPEDLAAVLRETAWFDPQPRSLLRGLDTADLLQRLISLEVHLGAGDGVVPRDSQAPDVFGWVPSIEVDAAHHLLPSHPDVISEVLTRIEQLHAGGPRTVLLIGPDFTDHTAWPRCWPHRRCRAPPTRARRSTCASPGATRRRYRWTG